MSVRVEELTDEQVAYLLSALVDLKKTYRDNNALDDCQNVENLILAIQDKKLYCGGTIK